MATLLHVEVDFTGRSIVLRYQIPEDAHSSGLAAARWRRARRVPFGDLAGFGADIVESELDLMVSRVLRELRGAWEQDAFF